MKVAERLSSVNLSKIETYLYTLVACVAFIMSGLFKIYDWLTDVFDTHGDPRTKGWFLMSNPLPTVMICLCYVAFVKYLGPKIMANRKPFELRNTLILYNLFQVVFSAWLFYECLMSGWWGDYSYRCQPVDRSTSEYAMRLAVSGWFTGEYSLKCQPVDHSRKPKVMRMVRICWWYYFSKFTEFADTIFFILRKKTRHVSTLHVIHHGIMPFSVWFGVRFMPGGHSTFFGLLNTFVHIIMYAYYMLAALGPHMEKYLWWKKYLTGLQMVQFIAIMVHAFQLLFIECDYPRSFVIWIGAHAVMFFFLFKQFYNESYSKANKVKVEADAKNGTLPQKNGDIKSHSYSKQSDYYVNGDGISRPDLVQRIVSASS